MPKPPWNAIEIAIHLFANACARGNPAASGSRAGKGKRIDHQRLTRCRRITLLWLRAAFCSLLALAAIGQSAACAETVSPEPEKTGPLIWQIKLRDARAETRPGVYGSSSAHYEVTIVNGSGIYIRRLYLAGTLQRGASSKRGAFVWQVPGGVQAGKTVLLDLSPALSSFLRGAPIAVSARDFKVEVIGFEDENGRIYGDFALK